MILNKLREKGSLEVDKTNSPMNRIDFIDEFTKLYTQTKVSRMDADIKSVLKCTDKTARFLAVRACKVWCLWLELISKGFILMSFEEFFKWGTENSVIGLEHCELLLTQPDTFKKLKDMDRIEKTSILNFIDINNLNKFKEFDLVNNWTGTIRIETAKDKFHSIPSYNLNGVIKLSDISYRGTRVDPWKYVTPDNFRYFTSFLKHNKEDR